MINTDIHYTPTIYPIYDIPIEELALTLNGKKRKIKKADFVASMQASGLEEKVINNLYVLGLKYAEVAEKLDIPEGTVKSRIYCIKQKLQILLKDYR